MNVETAWGRNYARAGIRVPSSMGRIGLVDMVNPVLGRSLSRLFDPMRETAIAEIGGFQACTPPVLTHLSQVFHGCWVATIGMRFYLQRVGSKVRLAACWLDIERNQREESIHDLRSL